MKEQLEDLGLDRKLTKAVEELPETRDLWPAIYDQLQAALDIVGARRFFASPVQNARHNFSSRFAVALVGPRRVLTVAAFAIALLAMVVLTPGIIAWAGRNVSALMEQLGLRQAPVDLGKPLLPPGMVVEEGLNQQQAQQRLTFPLALPTYMPDGYALPSAYNVYTGPYQYAWGRVMRGNNQDTADPARINIYEMPAAETAQVGDQFFGGALAVGDSAVVPVNIYSIGSVGDTQGLWLQVPDVIETDHSGQTRVVRYSNMLRWERNGVRITLGVPDDMSMSEAVKIAESFR